ncbi:fucosyltransferase [Klebsormidium nitens]|uniref:Fucosyltransferase n=1 Tax=Klebsormidium nitens TaxID=105231 RepID=A0A1Y1IWY9_KLENI|nr:fucosyltransferase [Klebsormidium nitens]|eukprot:GAQ92778.1 fucosyltransferase [Klebsormidium nitens]
MSGGTAIPPLLKAIRGYQMGLENFAPAAPPSPQILDFLARLKAKTLPLGPYAPSGGACLARKERAEYPPRKVDDANGIAAQVFDAYAAYHRGCISNMKNVTEAWRGEEPPEGCQFVVWSGRAGLGNKMLNLASTFMYAVLAQRVLLVNPGVEAALGQLFCEPFPGSSWLLPEEFPVLKMFDNLPWPMSDVGALTACEEEMKELETRTWFIFPHDTWNNYWLPGLYVHPTKRLLLKELFPDNQVFHRLSRYLYLPQDRIWTRVTSFYNQHMAGATKSVGLQIRQKGDGKELYYQRTSDNALTCMAEHELIPRLVDTLPTQEGVEISEASSKDAFDVLFVASMIPQYEEHLREVFSKNKTVAGRRVKVLSATHEQEEKWSDLSHYDSAVVDVWLLSFTDRQIITQTSTFGYVASSIAGTNPYYANYYSCERAKNHDPCWHSAPQYLVCPKMPNVGGPIHMASPEMERCSDFFGGVTLVDAKSSYLEAS